VNLILNQEEKAEKPCKKGVNQDCGALDGALGPLLDETLEETIRLGVPCISVVRGACWLGPRGHLHPLESGGGGGSDAPTFPKGSMVSIAENLTERASSIDPQNFNASKASLNACKKIAQKRPAAAKKTRRSELPGATTK
jgi:hypothetical protein